MIFFLGPSWVLIIIPPCTAACPPAKPLLPIQNPPYRLLPRNPQVVQERSVRAAARETHKVQAYRDWSRMKAVTEAAVRNLRDVDPPASATERGREERWLEVREKARYSCEQEPDAVIYLVHCFSFFLS